MKKTQLLAGISIAALALVATATSAGSTQFPGQNGKFAFYSTRDDANGEIYTSNSDGSGVTRLTTNSASEDFPSWSPGGTKIAFSSDRDGNLEIYVMNADGTNPMSVRSSSSDDQVPTWSPDGTKIAFTSFLSGTTWGIYTVNIDGSGLTTVISGSSDNEDQSWQSTAIAPVTTTTTSTAMDKPTVPAFTG